jgi:hypothetical protein
VARTLLGMGTGSPTTLWIRALPKPKPAKTRGSNQTRVLLARAKKTLTVFDGVL